VFYFSTQENPIVVGAHIHTFILNSTEDHVIQILAVLFVHQIGILLVEGGAYVQNLFIKQNMWDEAWVIRTQHPLDEGILAPNVWGRKIDKIKIGSEVIVGVKRDYLK
jgi:riboflavin biosynthesis pyrimidine reductase